MSSVGVPGFDALFQDVNKLKSGDQEDHEGIAGSELPELELSMSDEDLIKLTKDWQKGWEQYQGEQRRRWDDNEKYWKGMNRLDGKGYNSDSTKPNPDNLIFETLETFLPIATRENPEPVVDADNTDVGNDVASRVQSMLEYLTKKNDLKLTLKSVMRNWSLYFLGCLKVGWSVKNNEIAIASLRPKKLILDKDATIVNGEYTGEFIGEIRKNKAADLIRIFPHCKSWLPDLVQGKMGTEIQYTEWWTDEYVFWTFKDKVLDKKKNPHWNYDMEVPRVDDFGNVQSEVARGKNHFPGPKKPYVFLSIFNLGLHPFDETGLVHQNLRMQDMILKRLVQIDKNADNTNGGAVVSGDFFTKEQAAKVGEAKRRGETVWVPTGDIGRAYRQDVGPPMPAFVYDSLRDYRQEFKNNFGLTGSTAGSLNQERSVRGKILARQSDTDRISGGIVEFLEQMTEQTYNWFVQLMYVYYDEAHTASIVGPDKAKSFISLKNTDFGPQLVVTVKDGSMLPKDPLARRNEALELWAQHAIDPVTLYTMLDYPNPHESAKKLYQWMTNPGSLFPDLPPPPMPGLPGPGAGRPQLPGTEGKTAGNMGNIPLPQINE